MNIAVKIINRSSNDLPAYKTEQAAGFDFSSNEDDFVLDPGQRKLVSTGIFVELPKGYELQIRSRSGLSYKKGLIVLNAPGTIDSDYRGEIKILLYNSNISTIPTSDAEEGSLCQWNKVVEPDEEGLFLGPVLVEKGERIAQGVFAKHETIEWVLVESLNDTERSDGGFGSTGSKE